MKFLDKKGKEYTMYDFLIILGLIVMIPITWISTTHTKGDKDND